MCTPCTGITLFPFIVLNLFADDSKILTTILKDRAEVANDDIGRAALQRDLDITKRWANKWKMDFNVDKCKIMHLGRLNPKYSYTMDGVELTVGVGGTIYFIS